MAALALIALAGCGLSFAGIDWDGNPDTPNSIDIVFASPIALEIEPSAPLTPEIISIRLGPVQNFYCFHEHVPERAPPILS
jgi:hypothetical protein